MASVTQKIRLREILTGLQEQNPHLTDKFSLDKQECAVGLTEGETVFMLYSTAVGFDSVIDCRGEGGYPTCPRKDW